MKTEKQTSDANRLFVPLASEPFDWFASHRKRWEIRRARGAFHTLRLIAGRAVELRRGYSTPDRLHATIGAVVAGDTLGDLLARVPWELVIPPATSREDAVDRATSILGPKPGPFVAFECVLKTIAPIYEVFGTRSGDTLPPL